MVGLHLLTHLLLSSAALIYIFASNWTTACLQCHAMQPQWHLAAAAFPIRHITFCHQTLLQCCLHTVPDYCAGIAAMQPKAPAYKCCVSVQHHT